MSALIMYNKPLTAFTQGHEGVNPKRAERVLSMYEPVIKDAARDLIDSLEGMERILLACLGKSQNLNAQDPLD